MRAAATLLCLTALLAGCGMLPASNDFVQEGNYLTFEHPFTDAAADAARQKAEQHCAYSRKVAVRTTGVCSLQRCTTHYQCMDAPDAAAPAATAPRK